MAKKRDQIRMTDAEREAFIEEQKSLQVATLNKDGSVHLTTLWFAVGLGMLLFPFAEGLNRKGRNALENG